MKNTYLFLSLLTLLIGLSVQCKKKCYDPTNPQCENYDPCYGKKLVSAAFKIQEVVSFPFNTIPDAWGESPDTDTIATYGIQFTALEDGAEYEWHIGREVLTGKSVYRQNFTPFDTYPITLIVKKQPNKLCFPKDDGIDTLTRRMYAGSWLRHSPILGKFKGYVTNPMDTLTIEMMTVPINIGGIIDTTIVPYNWGGKQDICRYSAGGGYAKVIFKRLYFDYSGITTPNCYAAKGVFEIKGRGNDTLIINYTEQKTPENIVERVKRQFVGVRQ
jgi:hypothetical protein